MGNRKNRYLCQLNCAVPGIGTRLHDMSSIGELLEAAKIKELKRLIEGSREVVITCHLTPDGDAVGSTLALAHLLRMMGHTARVVTPDTPPKNLMGLPGASEIMPFSRYDTILRPIIERADLICCLDFNALHRIDRLAPLIASAKGAKVLIDHHLDPEDFADVVISHPEMSSTCILLYRLICDMGWKRRINRRIGECIYTGMMTDTGNFTYNSCHPYLYEAIAHLVSLGVDKDRIYNEVCNSNTVNRLRLNGYALAEKMQVYDSHRCAVITLTRDELNRYHYERGDTEALVNKPLSVPEMIYSIFLREEPDYIKVSMRSRGDFPVNVICSDHFGGGGHLNAAGGEYRGTMDDCVKLIETIMPQYDKYLPQ